MIRNLKFGNLITAEVRSNTNYERWYKVEYDTRTKKFNCLCLSFTLRLYCSHITEFSNKIKVPFIRTEIKKRELSQRKPQTHLIRKTQFYIHLITMVGHCEICNSTENLQVHHIVRIIDGGKEVPRNCQIVCTKCHKDLHAHQGRKA